MTLGQIRFSVTKKIGMTDLDTDDLRLIDSWANDAVLDVLIQTQCYIDIADLTTTVGEGDYTLDTDVLTIDEMTFLDSAGAVAGRPEPVTPREILSMRANNTAGDANILVYALSGSNLLMVYPTPTTVTSIRFYFVPRPTVLSDEDHDPSVLAYGGIPLEYHKALEFYVLKEAADFDDDRSSQYGGMYEQKLQQEYLKIRRHLNRKLGRMPRAQVGRRGWPRANNIYPAA